MTDTLTPGYLRLHQTGELRARAEKAWSNLEQCRGCAWLCHVNRLEDATGICGNGRRAKVSSCFPHFGEEDCLRGFAGSGTIFFAHCNLRCQFCQNYDVSQLGEGQEVAPETLATMMLNLQQQGCHNINFVSPSHVVPQILIALLLAAEAGLRLPLVYNTGGYDSMHTLRLLDGIIDIYMPDMKYADPDMALRYSKISDYPAVNQAAVREMHRQVSDLVLDERGIARQGLLVRHLVLPNQLAGTAEIAHFLAKEISGNTYINVMDQYRPAYCANRYPKLNRPTTRNEYRQSVKQVRTAGLHRLDQR
ncbi:MAG: radical SAM protein [Chloroflexota bacterium]|nr:radical SAM protein [Chloroflexota bacterium]